MLVQTPLSHTVFQMIKRKMTASDINREAAAIEGIGASLLPLSRQEINPAQQISTINTAHICSDLYVYFI